MHPQSHALGHVLQLTDNDHSSDEDEDEGDERHIYMWNESILVVP